MQKSARQFSAIALDHNHEQLNQLIKGDGGAIGLTENPGALLRWMVAGPELARVINEFDTPHHGEDKRHHEQSKGIQQEFKSNVTDMVNVLKEMENPFLDQGTQLTTLHTKVIMDSSVVLQVYTSEDTGKAQYIDYVTDRLTLCHKPVTDTISKNKFSLFKSTIKESTKSK